MAPTPIHSDCPAPWGRFEDKLDRLSDKIDEARRFQAAADASCHERHHSVDATFSAQREQIVKLETRTEQLGLLRATWLGGWRALAIVAGIAATVGGIVVGVLRLVLK